MPAPEPLLRVSHSLTAWTGSFGNVAAPVLLEEPNSLKSEQCSDLGLKITSHFIFKGNSVQIIFFFSFFFFFSSHTAAQGKF